MRTETGAMFSANGVASLGYELVSQLGRLIKLKLHVLLIMQLRCPTTKLRYVIMWGGRKKLYEILLWFLKTVFLAMHLFMQISVFLAGARTFMALRWYHFLLCASQHLCELKVGRGSCSLRKVW